MRHCLQIASGKGVLGQLALETGLPQSVIEIGLVAGIAYNLISVSFASVTHVRTVAVCARLLH